MKKIILTVSFLILGISFSNAQYLPFGTPDGSYTHPNPTFHAQGFYIGVIEGQQLVLSCPSPLVFNEVDNICDFGGGTCNEGGGPGTQTCTISLSNDGEVFGVALGEGKTKSVSCFPGYYACCSSETSFLENNGIKITARCLPNINP